MSRTATVPAAEWVTLGDASEYLGVAQGTIRRWADAGNLPHFRTPGGHRRFKREDLDLFMNRAGAGSQVPRGRYGGPAHVMVVDDDQSVREMLTAMLRSEGFSADATSNARDALIAMNRRLPDLVLLDVKMPGMDGWAMLRKIREKLDVEDLPVIVFSGEVSEDELRGAPSRGAQAYMRKPFDPHKLVAQTKALLLSEATA